MSIETIQRLGPGAMGPIEEAGRAARADRPSGPGATSFADTLGQALGKVDDYQVEADKEAEQVALGGGNLHEMALAMEKADVAMRLAMKVRNKAVDAYQEIMRMSI